jgi:hypothetical protein
MGAGDTSTFHLMDHESFYLGRIRIANNKWVFHPTPKTQELKELEDFFRAILQIGINSPIIF